MLASMLFEPSSGSSATRKAPSASSGDGLVALFGQDRANACAAEPVDEGLVRENVERLLRGSVVVRADRLVEVAGQSAAANEMGER